jgi:AraC-like DNA-binding protein
MSLPQLEHQPGNAIAAPPVTRLSTDDVPRPQRAAYWSDLVWHSFGRLRSDTYGDEDFAGRIALHDLGEVRLCRLQASRHRVVRTAGARGLSDPGYLKMVVQLRGRSLFEQDGRIACLKPGDWSLYDTTRSYLVSSGVPVDLHILLLPRDGILRDRPELAQLLVHRLRGTSGMGKVACDAIAKAFSEDGPEGSRAAAGARIVELLHLSLLEHYGLRLAPERPSVLRERIKLHVHREFADPDLGVESIARALNCSKRALHKAFEGEGHSLRDYIWDRRLQHALDELGKPTRERGSITDAAFASGFSSAAHFSRAFRARYGSSPRDWRRSHGVA